MLESGRRRTPGCRIKAALVTRHDYTVGFVRLLPSVLPREREITKHNGLQHDCCNPLILLAEWTGLEPATPGVTGRYSNQLNYHSSGLRGVVHAANRAFNCSTGSDAAQAATPG